MQLIREIISVFGGEGTHWEMLHENWMCGWTGLKSYSADKSRGQRVHESDKSFQHCLAITFANFDSLEVKIDSVRKIFKYRSIAVHFVGLGEHVSIVFIYVARIFSSADDMNGNVQIKLRRRHATRVGNILEKGTEQGVPITR